MRSVSVPLCERHVVEKTGHFLDVLGHLLDEMAGDMPWGLAVLRGVKAKKDNRHISEDSRVFFELSSRGVRVGRCG